MRQGVEEGAFGDAHAARWRRLRQADPVAAGIIMLVAAHCGFAPEMLLHRSRCAAAVARARQIAMYLLHTQKSRSQSAVADTFGRDRTTVRHACALVEDMREVPTFEAEMSGLEDCLALANGAYVLEVSHAG